MLEEATMQPERRSVEAAVRLDSSTTTASEPAPVTAGAAPVFAVSELNVAYGGKLALKGVDMEIFESQITAFIGPSGCGKSTYIRCFNRMNDLIPGAEVRGRGPATTAGHLRTRRRPRPGPRRRIGMVFQQPNPFSKSIYDNVAYGPRVLGHEEGARRAGRALAASAALWDEVKDRLKSSALRLSGGQQQRLCIARALAVEPEVLLMDEPCSALDPIATRRIEDLMTELKQDYTIVIVTHNMQQAARVADMTAFFQRRGATTRRTGHGILVEYDADDHDLHQPVRPADGGLRHRAGSDEGHAPGRARPARGEPPGGGRRTSSARCAARSTRSCSRDVELRRRGDRLRRRGRQRLPRDRGGRSESLLARQTPVAIDLRLVLAILHNDLHLERMADYCVTIAKLTKLVRTARRRDDLWRASRRWASGPRR